MNSPWMKSREAIQSRFEHTPEGVSNLDASNVARAPTRKLTIEISVVSHAYGFAGSPAVESPRMTVLPGGSLESRWTHVS